MTLSTGGVLSIKDVDVDSRPFWPCFYSYLYLKINRAPSERVKMKTFSSWGTIKYMSDSIRGMPGAPPKSASDYKLI